MSLDLQSLDRFTSKVLTAYRPSCPCPFCHYRRLVATGNVSYHVQNQIPGSTQAETTEEAASRSESRGRGYGEARTEALTDGEIIAALSEVA